jgi:hypothetical protein
MKMKWLDAPPNVPKYLLLALFPALLFLRPSWV